LLRQVLRIETTSFYRTGPRPLQVQLQEPCPPAPSVLWTPRSKVYQAPSGSAAAGFGWLSSSHRSRKCCWQALRSESLALPFGDELFGGHGHVGSVEGADRWILTGGCDARQFLSLLTFRPHPHSVRLRLEATTRTLPAEGEGRNWFVAPSWRRRNVNSQDSRAKAASSHEKTLLTSGRSTVDGCCAIWRVRIAADPGNLDNGGLPGFRDLLRFARRASGSRAASADRRITSLGAAQARDDGLEYINLCSRRSCSEIACLRFASFPAH
jgi:hypothetical protein